ncbi:MAG: hypothetical protein CME59_02480 [Halioglobus sp.]|nr:hypothetical protein [Halioglobus sp.]
MLEEHLAGLLGRLRYYDEVLEWVSQALRVSHGDAKQPHEAAMQRIQAEYDRSQKRIDAMYIDKLDGRIDAEFFERKNGACRVLCYRTAPGGMVSSRQSTGNRLICWRKMC